MKKKRLLAMALAASMVLSLGLTACEKEPVFSFGTDMEFAASGTERNSGSKKNTGKNPTTKPAEKASLNASLSVQAPTDGDKKISDNLFGLFLEDINFAVDGGLYTQLIKNNSFEYGELAKFGNTNGWEKVGTFESGIIDGTEDSTALGSRNTHYLRMRGEDEFGILNSGYTVGIAVTKGAKYNASLYVKSPVGYTGKVTVRMREKDEIIGEGSLDITATKTEWTRYEFAVTPTKTAAENVTIEFIFTKGTIDVDCLSVFPEEHFGSTNLRKDLGEALAALNPSFLRFPGGCVIEGKTFDSAYDWKASIGEGETMTYVDGATGQEVTETGSKDNRSLGIDIWANVNGTARNPYYMTYGIGFYEYFLLCEDLNAAPVPILNCGMSCMIQGVGSVGTPASNTRIDSEKFQAFVQDALDLVEFCKGDASTKWGSVRIAMGHAEPFELEYIGIGNEQWGTDYYRHYEAFREAFENAAKTNPMYKDLKLIVANGPNSGDRFAWDRIASSGLGADYAGLVDEHYYCSPDWFFANTGRYDTYDRDSVPVFLGEYAAQSNTLQAALAEGAYATALERNGDIIELAAYAPLFGNTTTNQWTPDMIYYSNNGYYNSINYYVQYLIANNKGSVLPQSELTVDTENAGLSGKIGVGTWSTSATFDNVVVTSNKTNEVLFNSDCSSLDGWQEIGGTWSTEDGKLVQTNTKSPANTITGDVMYIGDTSWNNYTLTLEATKTDGNEGFLIPICVQDKDNFIHWNIGGWTNTVSCLEQTSAGTKSGQISGTVTNIKLETGHTYEIKVVVDGSNIKCYLDGELRVDYSIGQKEPLYQVTSYDEATGDLIIKLVNPNDYAIDLDVALNGYNLTGKADVSILTGDDLSLTNYYNDQNAVVPSYSTMEVTNNFIYTVPYYSMVVLRIHTK